MDCERSGAEQARVIVGGVGKWHGVAGREDSVAGSGGDGSGRKRRGADEQDDGRCDDDNDSDADNDDDGQSRCALYIYGVYI